MNKLLFVIQKTGNSIRKINNEELPYYRENCETNIKFYCAITNDNYPDGIGLNLSLILLETNLGQLNTWNEFLSIITPSQIDSYKVDIPGYTLTGELNANQLKVVSPMNILELGISYTKIETPDIRDVKEFKETLTDLVIYKNNEIDINFKNCIGSINGIVCRPYEFKGELFLKEGAKALWGSYPDMIPNITLLDFSLIGDISIVPFYDCIAKFRTKNDIPNGNAIIDVILSDTVFNKTVFMVLNNTLYYPDEINVSSDSIVTITPQKTVMHSSIIMKHIAFDEYLQNTSIIQSDLTTEEMFREVIWQRDHFGSFFVIVDTPSISITKDNLIKEVESRTSTAIIPANTFMINSATKKIESHIRTEYEDHELYYKNKPFHASRLDHLFMDKQIAMPGFNSYFDRNNIIVDYYDSLYELIRITKG